MANIDEIKGQRTRLTNELGNCYFFVSDADIMMTVADENSRQAARDRAMLETICRISSKALKGQLSLNDITEQMRKGDSGRCTLLSEMARCIEEYGGGNWSNMEHG